MGIASLHYGEDYRVPLAMTVTRRFEMSVTVFIRYQLDPFKRAMFEEYGKRKLRRSRRYCRWHRLHRRHYLRPQNARLRQPYGQAPVGGAASLRRPCNTCHLHDRREAVCRDRCRWWARSAMANWRRLRCVRVTLSRAGHTPQSRASVERRGSREIRKRDRNHFGRCTGQQVNRSG